MKILSPALSFSLLIEKFKCSHTPPQCLLSVSILFFLPSQYKKSPNNERLEEIECTHKHKAKAIFFFGFSIGFLLFLQTIVCFFPAIRVVYCLLFQLMSFLFYPPNCQAQTNHQLQRHTHTPMCV